MGTDPKSSVVDCNLQVHGGPNLFVASCSVFPGGGSSNPTFTMMALTLRLGTHLANECIRGVSFPVREQLAS
jgi:choline dehydrogenase-like flavoprotein